jgi:hypothetical protein
MIASFITEHLEQVRQLVRQAQARIVVVSPFVDDAAVDLLLEQRGKAQLHLIFAWPEELGSPASLQPTALAKLLEVGQLVQYVPAARRLHAKLYIADDARVLVTSANLTGRGLGLKDRSNAEAGVLLEDADRVAEVMEWVDGLEAVDLVEEDLARLRAWRAGQPIPEPTAPPLSRLEALHAAFGAAQDRGLISSFAHVLRGAGKYAFRIEIPGVERTLLVKARASQPDPRKPGVAFHHELHARDLSVDGLDGFVFVPLTVQRTLDDDAPLVFMPFDRIIGRGRRKLSPAWLREVSSGQRRVSLEADDDGWSLRAGTVRISLEGCEDSTRAFADDYR